MINEGYAYEFSEELSEEVLLVIAGMAGVVMLVGAVISIVTYVFQSVGLYSIAKRRGIRNPWLAWLPVGYYWIAGSISDQYRYVTRGEDKKRRIILLVLSIVGMVLSGAATVTTGSSLIEMLEYLAVEDYEGVMGVSDGSGLVSTIQSIVQLALFVFWNMALYDLYSSCDPKNNVLFLVLGIIFGITVPFFIFACRKKDFGMPNPQAEPRTVYGEPEPRQYREPWDHE